MVAGYSNKFVVIADYRKASSKLGQAWEYVPIEVLALAYRPLMARVEEQLGGRCEVYVSSDSVVLVSLSSQVRMAKAKAGPVITDNGGMIIDWYDAFYIQHHRSLTHGSHCQVLGQAV